MRRTAFSDYTPRVPALPGHGAPQQHGGDMAPPAFRNLHTPRIDRNLQQGKAGTSR